MEQSVHDERDNRNKKLMANLRKMGERSLANRFARFYYVNETRGFEKWKEWIEFEKHKEKVI